MKKITGCILIGGKSSRMGGGLKSLKHFNNKSILDKIIERSKNQVSSLAINSNKNNKGLKKYFLPIFPDIIKGFQGPLAGIHASLNWTKKNNPSHKWVMTFAGDTPFFPNNIVDRLYYEAIKQNTKIIIAKSFGRNHPVFGLWHISLERDLFKSIENKNIRKIELWAKQHLYKTVNFSKKKFDPFFNINTFEDLIEAEKIENQILDK